MGNICTFSGFSGRLVSSLGIPFNTHYHIEQLAIQTSLLLMYADLEKGGDCLRVCMCVFHGLELLCSLLCDQTTTLISCWDE